MGNVVKDNYLTTSAIVDEMNTYSLNEVPLKDNLVYEEYTIIKKLYSEILQHQDTNILLLEKDLQQARIGIVEAGKSSIEEILKADNLYRNVIATGKSMIEERQGMYIGFENNKQVQEVLNKMTRNFKEGKVTKNRDIGNVKMSNPTDYELDIVKPYGVITNLDTKELDFHKGVDIRAPRGTELKALYSGEVIVSNKENIIISHGDSVVTVYSGFGKNLVKDKDTVTQGSSIAKSKDEHIHIGLFINGNPINITNSLNKERTYND